MHRTHDVRGIGADRIRIRAPNDRLRREMKDYFRRKLGHRGFELGIIADVAANIVHDGTDRRPG